RRGAGPNACAAAARDAAHARAGRLGRDREPADYRLPVRNARRLERHRTNAARAVRSGARGAEPVFSRRSRALRCDLPLRLRAPQMSLRVAKPGLLTTVQDGGRWGLQHLGVVPCGAMDRVALALANALVGNRSGEGALEVTLL